VYIDNQHVTSLHALQPYAFSVSLKTCEGKEGNIYQPPFLEAKQKYFNIRAVKGWGGGDGRRVRIVVTFLLYRVW
jgi:hypothetical protein